MGLVSFLFQFIQNTQIVSKHRINHTVTFQENHIISGAKHNLQSAGKKKIITIRVRKQLNRVRTRKQI